MAKAYGDKENRDCKGTKEAFDIRWCGAIAVPAGADARGFKIGFSFSLTS
ncbi:MAG: hypothetical protein WC476_05615 [Phycisphaerae bacterium]|jgi:hypothetical protein